MSDIDPEVQRQATKNCKSCGAPVLWCMSQHNRAMPVDVEKVYGGNIELVTELEGITALVVKPAGDVERWVSHFSSCPQADEHRKPALPADPAAVPMPFGKHKDEPLGQINRHYLEWAVENCTFRDPAVKAAIVAVLAAREGT